MCSRYKIQIPELFKSTSVLRCPPRGADYSHPALPLLTALPQGGLTNSPCRNPAWPVPGGGTRFKIFGIIKGGFSVDLLPGHLHLLLCPWCPWLTRLQWCSQQERKKRNKEEKTRRRFPHYSLLECLGYFASGSENIGLPLHLHAMNDRHFRSTAGVCFSDQYS